MKNLLLTLSGCLAMVHILLPVSSCMMGSTSSHPFASAVTGFPLNKGIMPDNTVRQTIDELIRNHDAVLDYTLKLIKQNNTIP